MVKWEQPCKLEKGTRLPERQSINSPLLLLQKKKIEIARLDACVGCIKKERWIQREGKYYETKVNSEYEGVGT